jgi:hypothetical protein
MTTEPCCDVGGLDVVLGVDVVVGLDVELGLDVEPLRLVASEPPEHADNTAAKIASRTSRTTNTYCPFWSASVVGSLGERVPEVRRPEKRRDPR